MDKQIIIDGLLISYSEVPKDSGKTLLFLHGWRSSKEVWGRVLADPLAKDFSRYALDLPGFGGSQKPMRAMTIGDYAGLTAEFVKKLDLKDISVIGHSFGGRIGIVLASRYPELVSKLVLADSAGFAAPAQKKNLMKMAAKIAKPFFRPAFMQPLRKKIYQKIGAEDYVATPELRETFVNVTGEDLTPDLKNIKVPTLIINGENDLDTPVEFGKRMQSLILNSKFLILPNAGHFSFVDQPEKFAEELNIFLN